MESRTTERQAGDRTAAQAKAACAGAPHEIPHPRKTARFPRGPGPKATEIALLVLG